MNNFKLKKVFIYSISGIIIFLIPLLIAKIVVVNQFQWMTSDNDWIGFWGGYFGGLLTLFGVLITINYTRKEEYFRRKLTIRPYIAIKNMNCTIPIDEKNVIRLGVGCFAKPEPSQGYMFIEKLSLNCVIENVGLGTAIGLVIKNYKIEDKLFIACSDPVVGFRINDEYYINLEIYYRTLHGNDLSMRFIQESFENLADQPEANTLVKINFSIFLEYEDLLGTKLKQEIVFYNHIINKFPQSEINILHWGLERVGKPVEISQQ